MARKFFFSVVSLIFITGAAQAIEQKPLPLAHAPGTQPIALPPRPNIPADRATRPQPSADILARKPVKARTTKPLAATEDMTSEQAQQILSIFAAAD